MIVLGVDLGERRIGFAVCDEMGMIASPLRSERICNLSDTVGVIERVREETASVRVVVGHPLNMNGKPGPKAREAEEVVRSLCENGIDARLWDERLTTAEAERAMKGASMSRKNRMGNIDAVAAQRILDSYLRSLE